MRTLVTFAAMLLLLLFAVGEQSNAKETAEGWDNPSATHPWGGDETPDNPGDGTSGDRPSTPDRSANIISTSTIPYLDYLIYRFVYEPMFNRTDSRIYRSESVVKDRKFDSNNRQR